MKAVTLFCLAVVTLSTTLLHADTPTATPSEKQKEIAKMLKITGVEKMMNQMVSQLVATFKEKSPNVPASFWEKFESSLDAHAVVQRIIPIYDKHYSLEDLKAVNAFYATPAGQHLLGAMPQVMQESMLIGQQWGRELAEKAIKEIKAEEIEVGK